MAARWQQASAVAFACPLRPTGRGNGIGIAASVAALATFLPCYLLTVIPAPYFKRYAKRAGIAAFVTGVTSAATGAIAGAVIVLSRRSILDVPTAALAIVTAFILFNAKRVPEPAIIGAAAVVGLLAYPG